MQTNTETRLATRPVRKLLAIDGGGVRGAISIEVLARIEQILRARTDQPNLVLADYFDFIGGTSIGGVISACLSIGMTTDEVRTFANENVEHFFLPAKVWSRHRQKYSGDGIKKSLIDLFGDMTLGSDRLKTLLLVVLRNANTDSPWLVTNNPKAKYNDLSRPDCNLHIPLWQLLRGTTAAPTLFPPERIELSGHQFHFVDGAVTIANNPAFQLFLQATLPEYQLGWPTGSEQMLLVSVGTGTVPTANSASANLVTNAIAQIRCLLAAASIEQDRLCRVFGRCIAGDWIDHEVGDLIGARTGWPKQFTYCRYDVELSSSGLESIGYHGPPKRLQKMDNPASLEVNRQVGQLLADARVRSEHFAGFH